MKRRVLRSSLLVLLAQVTLSACGESRQGYARIHDAVLTSDDRGIVILVESGTRN